MSNVVEIVEVGPRDGLQNEPDAVSVEDRIALVNALSVVGFRRIEEMVGRVDRLVQRGVDHRRARTLDLSPLLAQPESEDDRRKTRDQYHKLENKLDHCLNWSGSGSFQDDLCLLMAEIN